MADNPVTLQLIAFGQGMITCVSNATNWQRVTLRWGGTEVVFQGTGERTPMIWGPDKQNVYKLPETAAATTMTVLFEYSTTGSGGPFVSARVQDPTVMSNDPYVLTEVVSEDGRDDDNNDSYFSMMLVKPYAAQATPLEGPRVSADLTNAGNPNSSVPAGEHALQDGQMLSMHAKTYYDAPHVQGGDEHYIDVIYNAGMSGGIRYAGTGWHMTNGSWAVRSTPFGGFLTVYVEISGCEYVGLESAVMTLETLIAYWWSRPTGQYASPDWSTTMHGTQYHVTRVTP